MHAARLSTGKDETMAFLITECESHGVKVCEDKSSAIIYQDMARDFQAANVFGIIDGWIDSWACCEDMRVADTGEEID